MFLRKIRIIKPKQINSQEIYGITIPPDMADFYKDTYFIISKSGTSIILISGANQIDSNVKLEDFKV